MISIDDKSAKIKLRRETERERERKIVSEREREIWKKDGERARGGDRECGSIKLWWSNKMIMWTLVIHQNNNNIQEVSTRGSH